MHGKTQAEEARPLQQNHLQNPLKQSDKSPSIMKITQTSALMFLLSAAVSTKNVVAFTPKGLVPTGARNYHRSLTSLNAEQKKQNQQQGEIGRVQ